MDLILIKIIYCSVIIFFGILFHGVIFLALNIINQFIFYVFYFFSLFFQISIYLWILLILLILLFNIIIIFIIIILLIFLIFIFLIIILYLLCHPLCHWFSLRFSIMCLKHNWFQILLHQLQDNNIPLCYLIHIPNRIDCNPHWRLTHHLNFICFYLQNLPSFELKITKIFPETWDDFFNINPLSYFLHVNIKHWYSRRRYSFNLSIQCSYNISWIII